MHDLPSTICWFNDLAVGKRWKGNRALQKEFEAGIPNKTGNVSRDGSGGRTWAAWMGMWGLWHEYYGFVKITGAGEVLVEGGHNKEQIRRLIMNFQLPSTYGPHKELEPGFRIFPFRFVLRLLLDKRLDHYLTEDEIAFFVIVAKTDADYEDVLRKISMYRKKESENGLTLRDRSLFVARHKNQHRPKGRTDTSDDTPTYLKYIKDIANTVINNIKYLDELEHVHGEGKIRIRPHKQSDITRLVDDHDRRFQFSTLYEIDPAGFVERFGLRFNRMKASSKKTRPKMPREKNQARIKDAIDTYRRYHPSPDRANMIEYVCNEAGCRANDVEDIMSQFPELDPDAPVQSGHSADPFDIQYLKCGTSGTESGDFERMTRSIVNNMGFPTKKVSIKEKGTLFGSGPEVDGLMLNNPTQKSCILECKSGAAYTITIGDRQKMSDVYIKNLKTHTVDGVEYAIDMVVYVVGSGIVRGRNHFNQIKRKRNVGGSIISARDMLDIYRGHKAGELSSDDMWNMLKRNRVKEFLRQSRGS